MMSGVIVRELHTVWNAFLSGAFITIVYDLLRIFRRAVLHGNGWIAVEDAVFWLWTSVWSFSVLYRENDGSLRSYTLLAMALGMLLYHNTVSGVFVEFAGRILRKLVLFLIFPLKKMKKCTLFFRKKLKKLVKGIIMKIIRNRK